MLIRSPECKLINGYFSERKRLLLVLVSEDGVGAIIYLKNILVNGIYTDIYSWEIAINADLVNYFF